MLRVLHTVASLAPRHGGPTAAALGMTKALRAEGVDARILSSDDDLGGRLEVPLQQWAEHEGVPCCFLPRVRARQHTLVGFTWTPAYHGWLLAHGSKFDFIHVHTVFSHPANVALKAARSLGKPACVRPLGQLCRWSMRQRSWLKRMQLALVTRRNVDNARFIHCTSKMEAAETAELDFRPPCKVLPHGLDLPPVVDGARESLRASLGLPQDRKLVVFMSRFHEKKGIELLIDTCAALPDDFDLVLAGTGDAGYVHSLRQRLAQTGLAKRTHWQGFVQGAAKWQLLQGSDLFVLPSHSENFGIVVLEAIACGLPVVVSDQVALKEEVVEHQLGAVVPLQTAALGEALAALLSDKEGREAVRQRGLRATQEHFSWPAAARRLIAAYSEALSTQ